MIENKNLYTQSFYDGQMNESLLSAQEIVPYIVQIIQPKSVVDVGCGIGTWASIFLKSGVSEVLGVDGEYVNTAQLLIPVDRFQAHDLKKSLSIEKKFDLAVSLEVIEHLDKIEGVQLVASLVSLAPVVVFSGAIPLQGGTNHINEQWQSYWATEFAKHEYQAYDLVRPVFWTNEKVNNCYKQNIIVYIKKGYLSGNQITETVSETTNLKSLDVVHPDAWISRNAYMQINFISIVKHYGRPCKKFIQSLFKI